FSLLSSGNAVDHLAQAAQRARDALNGLEDAANTLTQAHIDLSRSALEVAATHTAAEKAHNAYLGSLQRFGSKAQQTIDLYRQWRMAVLDHTQAVLDNSRAQEELGKARATLKQVADAGESLRRAAYGEAGGAKQATLSYQDLRNKLVELVKDENASADAGFRHFQALEKTHPAAAAAARESANYA